MQPFLDQISSFDFQTLEWLIEELHGCVEEGVAGAERRLQLCQEVWRRKMSEDRTLPPEVRRLYALGHLGTRIGTPRW